METLETAVTDQEDRLVAAEENIQGIQQVSLLTTSLFNSLKTLDPNTCRPKHPSLPQPQLDIPNLGTGFVVVNSSKSNIVASFFVTSLIYCREKLE